MEIGKMISGMEEAVIISLVEKLESMECGMQEF